MHNINEKHLNLRPMNDSPNYKLIYNKMLNPYRLITHHPDKAKLHAMLEAISRINEFSFIIDESI